MPTAKAATAVANAGRKAKAGIEALTEATASVEIAALKGEAKKLREVLLLALSGLSFAVGFVEGQQEDVPPTIAAALDAVKKALT